MISLCLNDAFHLLSCVFLTFVVCFSFAFPQLFGCFSYDLFGFFYFFCEPQAEVKRPQAADRRSKARGCRWKAEGWRPKASGPWPKARGLGCGRHPRCTQGHPKTSRRHPPAARRRPGAPRSTRLVGWLAGWQPTLDTRAESLKSLSHQLTPDAQLSHKATA